jgi:aryl-alcohol dehydrogenase-like predicted oxidoreductase
MPYVSARRRLQRRFPPRKTCVQFPNLRKSQTSFFSSKTVTEMSPKAPHILLGSGGGIIPSSTPEEVAAILKRLHSLASPIYGIDTAAVYGGGQTGKSERILGAAGIANAGLVLDTKVLVYWGERGDGREKDGGPLSRVNVLRSSKESLERLQVNKVRCLYAHQVDRNTPIAETVGAFGEVLKAGEAEVVSVRTPGNETK